MDELLNSVKIELLQIYRSKLNYIFFLLPIFYSYDIIKNNHYEYYSLSAYAVQILIFGSMLIGYNVYINEERNNCRDIFYILNFRVTKFISKIIAGIIFLTIANLILMMTPIITGVLWNLHIDIIVECLKYVLLYFWLTCIISFLIGLLIGLLELNELSYFVMIIISSLLGFIGKFFLGGINRINFFNTIMDIFNIGQYYIN